MFEVITTQRPRVARSLLAPLKEVKRSISGKRPAIVAIHVFDNWDLEKLLSPEAFNFQAWLLQLLSDDNGKKISAVQLTCEPTIKPFSGIVGVKQYPALLFENPNANIRIPEEFVKLIKKSKDDC